MKAFNNVYEKIGELASFISKPTGIIHVGGHLGQEMKWYKDIFSSVLFIEPIPKYADVLIKKGYKVIPVAISEKSGEIDFYLSEDDQLSSILKSKLKSKLIKVKSWPLRIVESREIINACYEVLAIDVQGASYQVLKSSDLNYKLIIFECSDVPRYEGETPKKEIIKFLEEKGFKIIGEYRHGEADVYDVVAKKYEEKI
jgi:FkbM family methyltransferase